MRTAAPFLPFLLLCLSLSSCAAPMLTSAIQVAQYGQTTFSGGTLETVYPHPFEKVEDAARKMVDDLSFGVVVERPSDGFLYMELSDLEGKSITIRVKKKTDSLTSVRVRVGFLGDQPYSNTIMSRITTILGPRDLNEPPLHPMGPTAPWPR